MAGPSAQMLREVSVDRMLKADVIPRMTVPGSVAFMPGGDDPAGFRAVDAGIVGERIGQRRTASRRPDARDRFEKPARAVDANSPVRM
ncbi:hypothetical protein GCM10009626_04040 [Brachybacterium sacelli]